MTWEARKQALHSSFAFCWEGNDFQKTMLWGDEYFSCLRAEDKNQGERFAWRGEGGDGGRGGAWVKMSRFKCLPDKSIFQLPVHHKFEKFPQSWWHIQFTIWEEIQHKFWREIKLLKFYRDGVSLNEKTIEWKNSCHFLMSKKSRF